MNFRKLENERLDCSYIMPDGVRCEGQALVEETESGQRFCDVHLSEYTAEHCDTESDRTKCNYLVNGIKCGEPALSIRSIRVSDSAKGTVIVLCAKHALEDFEKRSGSTGS